MNKSETIGTIAKALSDFQGEVSAVPKESSNPFYKSKYAELSTIISHTQKLLKKNGLSVSQLCNESLDTISITTLLMHTSGEWLSGSITMKPSKADPQGYGSAITYARRYSLSAILGLATEDDDDGNTASGKTDKPTVQTQKTSTPQNNAVDDSEVKNKAIKAIQSAKDIATLDKIESQAVEYHQEGKLTTKSYDEIGVELTKRQFELNPKGE